MSKVVPLEGFGGGGTPLNFKIVAYATEEELAAAQPKENTIGVITDVPITGYYFSATEPENMNEGKVWVYTGKASEVSFEVVDGVTIYPISAKQYVDGAWVDVTAMSYQNGKWADWWNGELFDNGDQFEFITGGWWQNSSMQVYGSTNTGTATVGTTLDIQSSSDGRGAVLTTINAIDLTDFNTLTAVLSKVTSTPFVAVHSFATGNVKDATAFIWASEAQEYSVDITGLSGKYYVSVCCNAGAGGGFSRIKLNR